MEDTKPIEVPRIKPGKLGHKTRRGKVIGRPRKPLEERWKPMRKPPAPIQKKERKHRVEDSDVLRRSITGLAKMGRSMDEMADILGVSKSYLHKHYRAEIKCGKEIANALVVENLYQQAMKDSPSSIQAGIYLTKARMGWRDKDEEKERAPAVVFDFSGLDYDERIRLMATIKGEKPPEEPEAIEAEYTVDE